MLRPQAIQNGIASFAVRTPTLLPATHTNSYALGEREVLLVEPATPYEEERRAFCEWARGLVSKGRRLVGLLVTHHHADHIGGAQFCSRELGLPLWAHRRTAELRPELGVARFVEEDESIVLEGPEDQSWQVMHTPGHASDHVCLFEAGHKVLIAGDMVAGVGTILIEPGDGDMICYLAELERLRRLGAKTVLPAHGQPITNPQEKFAGLISHRLMREEKLIAALRQYRKAGAELAQLLSTTYDDVPEEALGLAELSLRAHLDKLLVEGRAFQKQDRYFLV